MRDHSLRLGRVEGIEVDVHWSWLIIFILFTWTLATVFLPSFFQSWSGGTYLIVGGIGTVLLFVSVLLHELAHSLVARSRGIPVQNITLFVFGGVSNIGAEPRTARDEFAMAFVGPLTSQVLGVLAYLLLSLGSALPSTVQGILLILAYYNVSLAVFNLIPGFPLDGGRVLRSIVWAITHNLRQATSVATVVGKLIGYLFIFGGVFLAINGGFLGGLWLVFIGWFLQNAAEMSQQQSQVDSTLTGIRVDAVMRTNPVEVPSGTTLLDFVEHYALGRNLRVAPVASADNHLVGLITVAEARSVPRERWSNTKVEEVAVPADQLTVAHPDEPLVQALRDLSDDDVDQLPVVDHGDVVGLLTRSDVVRYIQVRRELDRKAA